MNSDQFQSLLRQVLTLGGSAAVTIAHANPDAVQSYMGAAAVVASLAWSMFAHK